MPRLFGDMWEDCVAETSLNWQGSINADVVLRMLIRDYCRWEETSDIALDLGESKRRSGLAPEGRLSSTQDVVGSFALDTDS